MVWRYLPAHLYVNVFQTSKDVIKEGAKCSNDYCWAIITAVLGICFKYSATDEDLISAEELSLPCLSATYPPLNYILLIPPRFHCLRCANPVCCLHSPKHRCINELLKVERCFHHMECSTHNEKVPSASNKEAAAGWEDGFFSFSVQLEMYIHQDWGRNKWWLSNGNEYAQCQQPN